MRSPRHSHALSITSALFVALALSACQLPQQADKKAAEIESLEDTNMVEVMLTAADPQEAVEWFRRASRANPERVDLRRGLAISLLRAKRPAEAALVYEKLVALPDATNEDRVNYADALIRTGDWEKAEAVLKSVPPTHETYKRYRLEAILADHKREWKKADTFYKTAAGMTPEPASVLNNWGFSKLQRGDAKAAEKLFLEAITYNPKLFTAKNNLVLARAAQGKYSLPPIPMTEEERAQLLYTLAVAAARDGRRDLARAFLREAIDTHPRHFAAAQRMLEKLERES